MTTAPQPEREEAQPRRTWWITVGCFIVVALVLTLTPGALDLGAWSRIRLHAPDWSALISQSMLVQAHVVTVTLALVIGLVQIFGPKGKTLHRVLGWSWVACMGSTAIMTLFIRDMNDGAFSPIHIFSFMALISLPIGVWLARAHHTKRHARTMVGLYVGLIIAGLTAVAPGRVIWELFFG